MKQTLILPAFLVAFTTAHADLVIEQKIEGAGQSGAVTTLKMKGSKLRLDIQTAVGAVSSIVDLDSGESLMLTHSPKTALKMSAAQTKETLDSIRTTAGTSDLPQAKPETTGRQEKLGEFNTEIFACKAGNSVQTLWVTKDLRNYANVKEQLDRLYRWPEPPVQKGVPSDLPGLPGVVVKTEMEASGKKSTWTVLSVKEEDLDAVLFEMPTDYRELAKAAPPAPAATPSPSK